MATYPTTWQPGQISNPDPVTPEILKMEGKLFGGQKASLTPSAPQTTLGSPTPRGLTPAPKPLNFAGVGSAWKKKGRDALTEFETRLGRTTTPAEREQMRQMIGYTDLTGEADVLGNQFDQWQQYAALHTPGAVWTPWSAPAGTTPTTPAPTTPVPTTPTGLPTPATWSGVGPAPAFTPPPVPGPFQAPTAESVLNEPGYAAGLRQGQESIEGSAAAGGILRTGKTLGDFARYGQEVRGPGCTAKPLTALRSSTPVNLVATACNSTPSARNMTRCTRTGPIVNGRPSLNSSATGRSKSTGRMISGGGSDLNGKKPCMARKTRYRRARDLEQDQWKRYLMEEERRRWLAELGAR